jgi:hypothetical protein
MSAREPLDLRLSARAGGAKRCAVCHGDAASAVECPSCATVVHAECREGRCPTLGCGVIRVTATPTRPAHVSGWRIFLVPLGIFVFGLAGVGVLRLVAPSVPPAVSPAAPTPTPPRVRLPGAADRAHAAADAERIAAACQAFWSDLRRYPETVDELMQDVDDRRWDGPYLAESDVRDPWGNPYTATFESTPGLEFVLVSRGPDGVPGGSNNLVVRHPLEDR